MKPSQKKMLDLAVEHLEQAVRMAPSNARYSALLGEAWLLCNDADAALAPLQSSFVADSHPRTAYLLALALLRLKREGEAEKLAGQAIEEAAGFHRAFAVRCEARETLGNLDGAIQDLQEACAIAPGNEVYQKRLGEMRARRAGEKLVARTERLSVAWLNPEYTYERRRKEGRGE